MGKSDTFCGIECKPFRIHLSYISVKVNRFIKVLRELLMAYCSWRGSMILSAVPREEWPQVRNKCSAMDALAGRRKEWGLHRNWVGNYLVEVRIFNHFKFEIS